MTPEIEPIAPEDVDAENLVALKNLEERRRRAKRKRIITIGVVCALVAVAIAAWFIINNASQSKAAEELKPETAVVTRTNLTASIQATGTISPGTNVEVTPEVSGVIQEVRVAEGQHVEAGDVLFTLKNADLEKSVSDAEAALNKARRSLDDANASVSTAWDTYYDAIDSYNELVDEANSAEASADGIAAQLTPFDHSSYLSAIEAANSSVTSAQDAVTDAQRAYDYAVEDADKRIIRAPVPGTILGLNATPGAAVGGATGGTSTTSGPLAKVANLESLGIDVEVNEVDVSNVAPGQRALITFTAIPDLQLEGTVTSVATIATTANNSTTGGGSGSGGVVTFKVSIAINGLDGRLKPGMSASVKILTKDIPDALVIPSSALLEDGATAQVFVVTNEKTLDGDLRAIEVADRAGAQVAVKSGLSEGEIVLAGTPDLGEGSAASSSSAPTR